MAWSKKHFGNSMERCLLRNGQDSQREYNGQHALCPGEVSPELIPWDGSSLAWEGMQSWDALA